MHPQTDGKKTMIRRVGIVVVWSLYTLVGVLGAHLVSAQETLQRHRFVVGFSALANGERVPGKRAQWFSDKGVLFYLFDDENPEALIKVLDGRVSNGHWWLDLAVTSGLSTRTFVEPLERQPNAEMWVFLTWRDSASGILVHCGFPLIKYLAGSDECSISGHGTSVSIRDAWTEDGTIPSKYVRFEAKGK